MKTYHFIFLFFTISSLLVGGSGTVDLEFDTYISGNQPESAEKLLSNNANTIGKEKLAEMRAILAECYYKNGLFAKSLELYRLSGKIKKNRKIYYYHKAMKEAAISSSKKMKFLKKTGIKELVARFIIDSSRKRRFGQETADLDTGIDMLDRAMAKRFTDFIMKRRPDRAEIYMNSNLSYMTPSIKEKMFYRMGKAWLTSFDYRNYDKAIKYLSVIDKADNFPTLKSYQRGMEFYKKNMVTEALKQFKKGNLGRLAAWMHGIIAEKHRAKGDVPKAKEHYKKALDIYRRALLTIDTPWSRKDNLRRLKFHKELTRCIKDRREQEEKNLLDRILKGSGAYCRTLDEYSIYYYCKEKVHELVRYKLLNPVKNLLPAMNFSSGKIDYSRNYGNKLVFDYQIVKENGKIEEARVPLRGVRGNNGRLSIQSLYITNFFHGPVGILHPDMQHLYHYRIHKKDDTVGDTQAWVLDVIPVSPGIVRHETNTILLYGRVWIDKRDYSIIRVSWVPRFNKRTKILQDISSLLRYKVGADFITDFTIRKGALRYPSLGRYCEYFIDNEGIRRNFTDLNIEFSDYKYFNTAAEINKESLVK